MSGCPRCGQFPPGLRCAAKRCPSRVRIVPVTRRRFEEACARPGAVIERLKVATPGWPELPLEYTGVSMSGGHFAVVDDFISERMSGRYVLNFDTWEIELNGAPLAFRPFFSWSPSPPPAVRLGGAP